MAETKTIKVLWTVIAVCLAAGAAYGYSFGADLALGALMGAYPDGVPVVVGFWLISATIALLVARIIRLSPGWLSMPFIVVTVVVVFGAVVGSHPHNWGVAGVMGVLAFFVRKIDAAPVSIPVPRPALSIDWNPAEHSDDENTVWCWLRAVEWGRWPLFLSQTIAPVLLIWLSWTAVVVTFFSANLLWALFVRYRMVSCTLAGRAVYLVMTRWITWPCTTAYLFYHRIVPEAWVALAWPVIMFSLGVVTPTAIGRIQSMFMEALGYVKKSAKA